MNVKSATTIYAAIFVSSQSLSCTTLQDICRTLCKYHFFAIKQRTQRKIYLVFFPDMILRRMNFREKKLSLKRNRLATQTSRVESKRKEKNLPKINEA